MERCLSTHDAKCAEFTPEFRKDEQTEAGIAPRIIGIVARGATHTGAERAAMGANVLPVTAGAVMLVVVVVDMSSAP